MKKKKLYAVTISHKNGFSTTSKVYHLVARSIPVAEKRALRLAVKEGDFIPDRKLFVSDVFYSGVVYL
jgi:hypothetical protein